VRAIRQANTIGGVVLMRLSASTLKDTSSKNPRVGHPPRLFNFCQALLFGVRWKVRDVNSSLTFKIKVYFNLATIHK
jgi:hypothetical protein